MNDFNRNHFDDPLMSIELKDQTHNLLDKNTENGGSKKFKIRNRQFRFLIMIAVAIILVVLIVPYIKAEVLSKNWENKLSAFDTSDLEEIYAVTIYDAKIFSYSANKKAEVLYVLGECEYIIIVELDWDAKHNCWIMIDASLMWSAHGGTAGEGKFYWPFYYGHKILGW